ncbi:MAG: ATP-grasp domain-containing protein [Anaerolineales bacterium]
MTDISTPVLVAGVGGASLGTEIIKCLNLARRYSVYGCDISPLAFGHFQEGVAKSYCIPRQGYVDSILEICRRHAIKVVIPGGEEPMKLLGEAADKLQQEGIRLAGNSPALISLCSDKNRLFEYLKQRNLPMPYSLPVTHVEDLKDFPTPCIIKPATGTGGSRFVFLAASESEARLYLRYVLDNCESALVQEYIPLDEGEFTIGVLSLPDGKVYTSIALKRLFHAKLSVLVNTKTGLISSGYSQGLIDHFPDLCRQAEEIATAIGSRGPINVQGRVRNGVLLPFEINPRFSASTYLRALAGVNEIDLFVQFLLHGRLPQTRPQIKPGYYLRSLTEQVVPKEEVEL